MYIAEYAKINLRHALTQLLGFENTATIQYSTDQRVAWSDQVLLEQEILAEEYRQVPVRLSSNNLH